MATLWQDLADLRHTLASVVTIINLLFGANVLDVHDSLHQDASQKNVLSGMNIVELSIACA